MLSVLAGKAGRLPWPRYFSTALAALMLLWLCQSGARLLWLLLPEPAPEPGDPAQVLNQSALQRAAAPPALAVDIEAVARLPFAGADSAALSLTGRAAQVQAAQETNLPLSLRGTVPSSDGTASRAIIAEGDTQSIAVPGDLLPISTQGVRLVEVAMAYVVIDNNGRHETLWMDESAAARRGTSGNLPAFAADPATPADALPAAAPAAPGLNLPPVFAQAASVSLQRSSDGQQGLQVMAKGDGRLFRRLGLRNEDLVLSVNGRDVLDPALPLLLQGAQDGPLELQLLRDGQLVTVALDTAVLHPAGE